MAKTKKPSTGLTKKHWIGYGLGDAGGCMTFALMGAFVTMYYTKILHVDPYILATLLLVWNIWDAVNDPMMGAFMDKMYAKKNNPKGKFRPWLLRATPLLALTAIAFWILPTFFEGLTMLVVLFFCKIAYEGIYTMFNIPMGSLLSAMSNNDVERASLSSARGLGSMIGNMIPVMIFPQVLKAFGDSNAIGYAIGATVCALVGMGMCFLHYYWTEERNVVKTPTNSTEKIKFTDIFRVFKVNRPFLALCIHGVCICTMQYVGSTLSGFMYADVLGDVGLMTTATALSLPLIIIILVFGPKLAKKFGLVPMIRYSLIIGCILYAGLFAVAILTDINPYLFMVWSALASGIGMVSIQMQWGMVGEAIDYNEYLTGKRTEGSIYGTFNLTRRIGQTIGNSAGVLALGLIGYNDAAGAVQTASTLFGLKALCILLPGIFLIGSWAAFKFVWNITPEVRAKMAAKKAASQEPAPQEIA